jgi:arginase
MHDLKILGAEFGLGARVHETANGPYALSRLLNKELSEKFEFVRIENYRNDTDVGNNLLEVIEYSNLLAKKVFSEMKNKKFPIVVGGDHSVAIATWSAIISYLKAEQNFGLLWIDAHMDSHTLETSPSKMYHGMPLACLLGRGNKILTKIMSSSTKLNPEHVVIFGVRSFEEGEYNFLKEIGVRIFFAKEIRNKGLKQSLFEAYNIIKKASSGYGVSVDLDFFDPSFAPGVGSPEASGFNPGEFISAADILFTNYLRGFEIVELNPELDIDNKTALIAVELIGSLLSKAYGKD